MATATATRYEGTFHGRANEVARVRREVAAWAGASSANEMAGIEAAAPRAAEEVTMNFRRVVAMRGKAYFGKSSRSTSKASHSAKRNRRQKL